MFLHTLILFALAACSVDREGLSTGAPAPEGQAQPGASSGQEESAGSGVPGEEKMLPTCDETQLNQPCDGDDTDSCINGVTGCMDGRVVCLESEPGKVEECDGLDNNCNGLIDENAGCECPVQNAFGYAYIYCFNRNEEDELNRNWEAAEAYCVERGYHLVTLEGLLMQRDGVFFVDDDVVHQTLQRYDGGRAWWIGYNDREREGTFTWTGGSEYAYANWYQDRPNSRKGDQDCVITNHIEDTNAGVAKWDDRHCTDLNPFICRSVERIQR